MFLCTMTAFACAEQKTDSLPRHGWFTYVPYGRSLLSDVHPYDIRGDLIGHTNRAVIDFAQTDKPLRASLLGCFGVTIPIWQGNYGENKQFGISITEMTYALLWLDIFEPITAPVVNTDFRVGIARPTFIHRLNKKFVKNYSITWSPFIHESTHMGDELQIQRMEMDYAIRRVNVSYNWTELTFTLNEPVDRTSSCHTFRAGVMLLWNWKEGWYSIKEAAGDGNPDLAHQKLSPWEAYFQYEYQSPATKHGFQGVASAEIRNRVVYGYDLFLKNGQPDTAGSDYRRFTYNTFVGMRFNVPNYEGFFSRISLGLRFYYGNCPYGQYRSIDNFMMFGISSIYQ